MSSWDSKLFEQNRMLCHICLNPALRNAWQATLAFTTSWKMLAPVFSKLEFGLNAGSLWALSGYSIPKAPLRCLDVHHGLVKERTP
mmetsp:Transcript_73952/g.208475  ORF Transcript_73952/g.208475 Transcript_73952/m.208475 type:complete len:86 (+) Transcript_73952:69-326(+)